LKKCARAPLPIVVIAEMLGVDPGDMAQFKRWSDAPQIR
jgi:cytochrome P450